MKAIILSIVLAVPVFSDSLSSIGLSVGGSYDPNPLGLPTGPVPFYPIPNEYRRVNGTNYNLGARRVFDQHENRIMGGGVGLNPKQFPTKPLPQWAFVSGEIRAESGDVVILEVGDGYVGIKGLPDALRTQKQFADYVLPTSATQQLPSGFVSRTTRRVDVYDFGTPIATPPEVMDAAKAAAAEKAAKAKAKQEQLDAAVAKFKAEQAAKKD